MSCCLIVGTLCFRNLNSTVPIDVVRIKSYMDSLLNLGSAVSKNNFKKREKKIEQGFRKIVMTF